MGDLVLLGHGSGGRLTAELLDRVMRPHFDLGEMDDAAVMRLGSTRLAFTTDSFVVDPLFFPGGDIGCLAVFGTVNDLAVQGAEPLWLSLSVIAEEGLPMPVLREIVGSVAKAADEVGVRIVTGDTKVVERGAVDKLILNTAGIGRLRKGADITASRIKPGDVILVTGAVGRHEIAVLSGRHGFDLNGARSDCGSVAPAAKVLIENLGDGVKWMRDPTRGGLATALNELAMANNLIVEVVEADIPVDRSTLDACDILGLDPFYLACEGRLLAVVAAGGAETALRLLRAVPEAEGSRLIGRIKAFDSNQPRVELETLFGSRRILRYLAADQQPRIC